ncbi:hypothetical protein COLO4_07699 [Corchorus olitorius]|uniref:Uncharacterized protein n=1 Tax=Corchorus olitorius TaxID=93759 RepID=A0A1R3KIV6_9ROSI|nr:hypothetical protein COLO4_07699 [Corchorus olitorius]
MASWNQRPTRDSLQSYIAKKIKFVLAITQMKWIFWHHEEVDV